VRLLKPIQVLHEPLIVTVNIPDNEIVSFQEQVVEHELPKKTEEVAKFQRLTNALFGEEYCYVPEKSDREILGEILSEKYS
jgi:hypothetical protein